MAYVLRQFDTPREMVDYLNDIVIGKAISIGKIYGLDGLTLIINNGSDRTVTFADATEGGLTLSEVVAQIEATHATLAASVRRRAYRPTTPPTVHLAFDTATWVVKGAGTANALLGFPAADQTVGAAAVVLSDIATITTDEGGNKFTVVHQ